MSFLDSITSYLGGIFSKKAQSVIGIDIGSSAIKVVEIKKKRGHAVLKTYGELALGPYASTEVGRATNLTPDKLAEVISIEARKYIPVPMNEVMLDWSIIPREDTFSTDEEAAKSENQKEDVLIVAIHNDYINSYQQIMSSASLSPSFYEIEIFSAIRAVVDQGVHAVMIIDMGARATKLYIVERGILRASHIINKGSQDITLAISKSLSVTVNEAENMKRVYGLKGGTEHKDLNEIIMVNLDYIFYEANTVLMNYQKKYNKNIAKVILTGGGVLLKGFTDLAKISFQTDVIYADPFNKLETPAFFAEQLAEAGPEFAVAIGVALRRLSEVQ